jgi:hypothetical protein
MNVISLYYSLDGQENEKKTFTEKWCLLGCYTVWLL